MSRDAQRSRDIEQRDPQDDPTLCSLCGVYIGAFPDKEYCDGCAREVGVEPPLRRCLHCGSEAPEPHMETIDVSPDDEYYPEIEYLCPSCAGGVPDADSDADTSMEGSEDA
jgi:hypothetical protein